ncbi:MAG: class I SAM-dependent methyltransferase [Anaerolineae bacterium]
MKKVQQYFATVARDWDQLRQSFYTEEVREAAIAKADLKNDMTVADIGTGTGFMILGLASLVTKVYGLDASSEMLAVAEENLAAFDNVQLRVADGEDIPLPTGSVDAVFANMYLHHCPDPLASIKEMARILKQGGKLVITDGDEHEHEWMRTEMADIWLGFNREQIRTWFAQAGLSEIEVDSVGSE